jgi:hypothetical protein
MAAQLVASKLDYRLIEFARAKLLLAAHHRQDYLHEVCSRTIALTGIGQARAAGFQVAILTYRSLVAE